MSNRKARARNANVVIEKELVISRCVGELLALPPDTCVMVDLLTPRVLFRRELETGRHWLNGPEFRLKKDDMVGSAEDVAAHLATVLRPHAERLLASRLAEALE